MTLLNPSGIRHSPNSSPKSRNLLVTLVHLWPARLRLWPCRMWMSKVICILPHLLIRRQDVEISHVGVKILAKPTTPWNSPGQQRLDDPMRWIASYSCYGSTYICNYFNDDVEILLKICRLNYLQNGHVCMSRSGVSSDGRGYYKCLNGRNNSCHCLVVGIIGDSLLLKILSWAFECCDVDATRD